jgi:uncharacterized protein DUF6894
MCVRSAMARFFLNIHDGSGFAEDPEGQDLADLDAARLQAIDGVRSLLSEEARHGRLDLFGSIEITDSNGATLLVVPFREAIDLHCNGQAT